ncbi:MAG TPA: tetratricopeptide repeat protein [Burkholderiales bacterium]|nr:tetratricopeptide repeat protein [Burkholderiales bacterium]
MKTGPRASALAETCRRGLALQQSGRLREAEQIYREILAAEPNHVDALHLLAIVMLQTARPESAVELLHRLISMDSRNGDAYYNLGYALFSTGRVAEAVESYGEALQRNPGDIRILIGRANAQLELGQPEAAVADCNAALAIEPQSAELFNNLGNALHALQRYGEALASFDRALALAPGYAQALNNRGNVLRDLRRYDEALVSYESISGEAPEYAEARNHRGNVLQDCKRYDAALASYDEALAIRPDYVDALVNRGSLLRDLKRYDEALASYDAALALAPDSADALSFRFDLKARCCDWSDWDAQSRALANRALAGFPVLPFVMLSAVDSPAVHSRAAAAYAGRYHAPARAPRPPSVLTPRKRLSVAYVSADFRAHPTAYLAAELFERHDRGKFEINAISLSGSDASPIRKRLEQGFDRFVDVASRSDEEVAALLRDLEVNIAVDLMGYTQDCRLGIFACRPAPLQVSYLGYPGTVGADYIDYIIADRYVIPTDAQGWYAERVAYLPDCYQVTDSTRVMPEAMPQRSEVGLPAQGFVFCSFNSVHKITPAIFDVWLRLLRRIDGSVLWLYADNPRARGNLIRMAAAKGLAAQRLVFADFAKYDQYLARFRLADLFLDNLPYNAHSTASDALWAGLPVLTCSGQSFPARVAGSLLNAIGLPELITHSMIEYEDLAVELATDGKLLAAIKAKLRQNARTCPLFDTARFCRHLEAAYITMWERHARGEGPQSFAVEPVV